MGLVQHASNTATTGSTLAATFGAGTTANNYIIVCVSNTLARTVSSISPSGFTKAVSNANGIFGIDSEIWYLDDTAGGHTTVTVTFSGTLNGAAGELDIYEWNGIVATTPLDKTNSGNSGSSTVTSWSSGSSGTLSQATEVAFGVVGALSGGGAVTLTGPGSPWTNETQLNGTTGQCQLSGYQAVSATTALTYNGTSSAAVAYCACIATFKTSSTIVVNLPVVKTTDNVPPFNLNVLLPVIQTTDNAPALTPEIPVLVFLPTIHTTDSVFPLIPTEPPVLIIAIVSQAVNDPLTNVPCPQGFTDFEPLNTGTNVNINAASINFNSTGQGSPGTIQAVGAGSIAIESGVTTHAGDSSCNLFLDSEWGGGNSGQANANIVAPPTNTNALTVNTTVMTVP